VIPAREIFFNVDLATILIVYTAMVFPFGYLALGIARRARMWLAGKQVNRFDQIGRRVMDLLRMSVFHGRIVRQRNLYAGVMHALIFGGFMLLFAGTLIVMVEMDIVQPIFGLSFLHGNFYLVFKLVLNTAGLALIAGILMAFYRRLVIRPATQDTTADDLILLTFLLVLAVQGFAVQALRLALTQDPWGPYSYVSWPMAVALRSLPLDITVVLHKLTWWSHFVTAFVFFCYVGYSKMVHAVTGAANVMFRRLKPRGELEPIADMDTTERFGAAQLEDYNWQQLMSLDACLHCGRCLEFCPAFNTGKPLRPRDVILELAGLQADKGGVFSGVPGEAENSGRFRWGQGADREMIGGVVSHDEIWDCTTCGACMEQCPVSIEHVPFIVDMRRNLVMEHNSFPPELKPVLASLERLGNPFQGVPPTRGDWVKKMEHPVQQMAEVKKAGKTVDYLFFVGCLGSFAARNQKVTMAVARILHAAGLSYAILGKEESCHGDPARRMGHEFLAQTMALKTIDRFNFYGVKKVITTCAHCFNAIRNEFPQLGGNYEVVHHSELIADLIASGKITLDKASALYQGNVTYHDPCYLGRYNDVFDAPRESLKGLKGIKVVEMPRNRKQSFCCGGGGGRALMKETRGTRINVARATEAAETGAGVVAASCPFCISMLEDAAGSMQQGGTQLRVLDIAELVASSMTAAEPPPPAPAANPTTGAAPG
jgi:Fe-S oxidoreductase/nitrate reductase gamma subunit